MSCQSRREQKYKVRKNCNDCVSESSPENRSTELKTMFRSLLDTIDTSRLMILYLPGMTKYFLQHRWEQAQESTTC